MKQFLLCKNEQVADEVIVAWITQFAKLKCPVAEVIKRIQLALLVPKKFVTEFATFWSVNLSEHYSTYKTIAPPKEDNDLVGKMFTDKEGGNWEITAVIEGHALCINVEGDKTTIPIDRLKHILDN